MIRSHHFNNVKKILRLDRISCICDLKYYHTYSIICNVNQIRSLGCTITCYFEPTFSFLGILDCRLDARPPNTQWKAEDRLRNPPLALLGVKIAGTALWDYKDLQKRKQIAKSDTLQKIKSEYTKDIVRHDVKHYA